MKKSNRILIGISFSLLITLGLLDNDAFIHRKTINWKNDSPLIWDDFRGYPVLFNKYSAAIHSLFEYEIFNESFDSIYVPTFMNTHHSWVRKIERESEVGLRHEQYHFNISEVIARKFRKAISELPESSLNKKTIQAIYRQHYFELDRIQDKYDDDTEHSVIIEAQKDWEYLVDSMLTELEYYSKPMVILKKQEEIQHTFYRELELNAFYELVGRYPLDSVTANLSRHYKFYYNDKNLIKIECRNREKLVHDEVFGAKAIEIERVEGEERWSFFDENGYKVLNNKGVHLIVLTKNNNEIIKQYFGINNKPIVNTEGVQQVVWDLDYKGRGQYAKFFNNNLDQVSNREGFYIVGCKYDNRNNLVEYLNYNEEKELENSKNGVAYYKYVYDERDNLIMVHSFDKNKMPCSHEDNIASRHYKYDLNGNVIRVSFKNSEGKTVFDDNKVAISYFKYDQYSNLIIESYFGANKNLIINDKGRGKLTFSYDSLGRLTESKNYDAYDYPLEDKNGICAIKYNYNKENLVVKEEQFHIDTIGEVVHQRNVVYGYNDDHRLLSETYYDSAGKLKSDSSGIVSISYKYDKNGNTIQIDHLNEDFNLHSHTQGVATFKYTFDSNNNKLEASYYDSIGELTNANNGVAMDKYRYDLQNRMIERRYLNSMFLPVKVGGVEVIRWNFDNRGNIKNEYYLNSKGKPISNIDGIARIEYFYNKENKHIESRFYNYNNKLVETENDGIAIIRFKYSENDECHEKSYYNKNNILQNLPEGYAVEKIEYNTQGLIAKRKYFSEYNQPIVTNYGYASVEWLYDKNQNVIAEIYRDENGFLIEDSEGYAIYNWIYNRNGEVYDYNSYKAEESNYYNIDYGYFISSVKDFFPYQQFFVTPKRNTGLQTTYFENGQKESEVFYVEGRQEGECTYWYKTGEIESVIEYHNGQRNGLTVEFYKSGQKSRELMYENNILIQESEITWYESGSLRSKYENGDCKYWNESGQLVKE